MQALLGPSNRSVTHSRHVPKARDIGLPSKPSRKDLLGKHRQPINNIASARVGAAQRGNELRIAAAGVDHSVDRAARENRHLPRRKLLCYEAGTILLDHVRRHVAQDANDVVGGARVEVRWELRAGTEVECGHCEFVVDGGGECRGVGVDDGAGRKGVGRLGSEVEEPLGVGRQQGKAVDLLGRSEELSIERWVGCHVDGGDGGG